MRWTYVSIGARPGSSRQNSANDGRSGTIHAEHPEQNPFVGPRAYETTETHLFFGRDAEARELVSRVVANRVTLLYAASGAGKTSLLNAGLIPRLEREERFEVLPSARLGRLVGEAPSAFDVRNIFVFSAILNWKEDGPEPGRPNELVAGTLQPEEAGLSPVWMDEGRVSTDASLADFLADRPHLKDTRARPLPRALIFDQFEELFSVHPEYWDQREGFFEQVAEALDRDPRLRIVLAIREDYLANLDPYLLILPEPVRFRLERLGPETALAAVTGPLRERDRSFAEGVAERLVDDLLTIRVDIGKLEPLKVRGEFVEPVQLQLVCRSLWADLPPHVVEITEDHLRDFGDVDQVLTRFYEEAIGAAVAATRIRENRLRNWTEDALITSVGTRGTIYRTVQSTAGLPNDVVDALEGKRLIRTERRAGARWYELTHDRLIEPIRDSNRRFEEVRVRRRWLRTTIAVAFLAVSGAVSALLLPSLGEPDFIRPAIELDAAPVAAELAEDGSVWIGLIKQGSGPRLVRLDPETLQPNRLTAFSGIPVDVEVEGGSGWVLTTDGVLPFDPTSSKFAPLVPVGGLPLRAYSALGSLWILLPNTDAVVRLDMETNEVVDKIPVGSDPRLITFVSGKIWVASVGDRMITPIAPSKNPLPPIPLPAAPVALINFNGEPLVATSDGSVIRVDPDSGVLTEIAHVSPGETHLIAADNHVWAWQEHDRIICRIDLTGSSPERHSLPFALEKLAELGDELWAVAVDGRIVTIDAEDASIRRTWGEIEEQLSLLIKDEERLRLLLFAEDGTVYELPPDTHSQ